MTRARLHRPEIDGSGPRSQELPSRGAGRVPLPLSVRAAIYGVAALLWVSGAVWLVLHYVFPQLSEFGPLPNPGEVPLMRTHGLIAVGGVFLIGWMMAAHVMARWSSDRNRRSGFVLGGAAVLLILSGYALYYTTGSSHDAAALVHEAVGVLSPAAALGHWWHNRPRG